MGTRALLLACLLMAGCGPVAIGVGIQKALEDESQDLVDPNVEILQGSGAGNTTGQAPPALYPAGRSVSFLLLANKRAKLDVFLQTPDFTGLVVVDVDGCPRDSEGDLIDNRGEVLGPLEPSALGGSGYSVFHDPAVAVDGEYTLWVRVRDGDGRVDCTFHRFTLDTVAPAAPTGARAEALAPREIAVSWTPPADADLLECLVHWDVLTEGGEATRRIPGDESSRVQGQSYNYLLDPAPASGPVGVPAGTRTVALRDLHPLRKHFVQVQAVDRAGNRSPLAAAAEVHVRARGGGDGTFGDAIPLSLGDRPGPLAIGDFNGDLLLDVVHASCEGTTVGLRFALGGTSGWTLATVLPPTDVPCPTDGPVVAAGDLDRDGYADFVVAGGGGEQPRVFALMGGPPGAGVPTVASVVETVFGTTGPDAGGPSPLERVVAIELADLDQDGRDDLLLHHEFRARLPGHSPGESGTLPRGGVSALRGLGDGSFDVSPLIHPEDPEEATGIEPGGVALGLFDGDTVVDVAFTDVGSVGVAVSKPGLKQEPFPRTTSGAPPVDLAAGDFDGDRILDLAVLNRDGSVAILVGNGESARGDATFGPAAPLPLNVGGPVAISAGDFDADGLLDLAVAGRDPAQVMILRRSGGTLSGEPDSFPVGNEPVSLHVADLDRDGIADLVVRHDRTDGPDGTVTVRMGKGAVGRGSLAFGALPDLVIPVDDLECVAAADLDRDGIQDLLAGTSLGSDTGVLAVRLGEGVNAQGDGTFSSPSTFVDATAQPVGTSAVGDFDRDGAPDLVTSPLPSNGEPSLFLGRLAGGVPTGTFFTGTPLLNSGPAVQMIAGDLDLDGFPDIACLTYDSGGYDVPVGFGRGDGTFFVSFVHQVDDTSKGFALAAGDFDGDGVPDLATLSEGRLELLSGRRTADVPDMPSRSYGSTFQDSIGGRSLLSWDVNGDARDDLVAIGGSLSILLSRRDAPRSDPFDVFSREETQGAWLARADFDGDGRADLLAGASILVADPASADGFAEAVAVPALEGLDSSPSQTTLGHRIAVADFDADGIPDVAVVAGEEIRIFLGHGTIVDR